MAGSAPATDLVYMVWWQRTGKARDPSGCGIYTTIQFIQTSYSTPVEDGSLSVQCQLRFLDGVS